MVSQQGVDPKKSEFLLKRLEDGVRWVSNDLRIKQSYLPASTHKIPHTLIALETGYCDGLNDYFVWDKNPYSFEAWNQDQTLFSAYKGSCVWVYQKIAKELGYETMSFWIDRLNYGSRFTGDESDLTTYWLKGPLKISIEEQIDFLTRLAKEELPLSSHTFEVGKKIMEQERGEDFTLYGKTGWAGGVGWFVGIVEKTNGETYVFAFNMDLSHFDALPLRRKVVLEVLNDLGIINSRKGNMTHKKMIESYMESVWNRKDVGVVKDLFSENAVIHSPLGQFKTPKEMTETINPSSSLKPSS